MARRISSTRSRRTPRKYRVFVSYSHHDQALARPMTDLVGLQGRRVFLDERGLKPGDEWEAKLLAELASADAVVVLWCCHSAKSKWVEREVDAAVKGKKLLVPVRLCEFPMTGSVASRQAVPFMVCRHSCDCGSATTLSPLAAPDSNTRPPLGFPGSAESPRTVLEQAIAAKIGVGSFAALGDVAAWWNQSLWKQRLRDAVMARIWPRFMVLAAAVLLALALLLAPVQHFLGALLLRIFYLALAVVGITFVIAVVRIVRTLLKFWRLRAASPQAKLLAFSVDTAISMGERGELPTAITSDQPEGNDMASDDLRPQDWPVADWGKDTAGALDSIKDYCVGRACAVHDWYVKKKTAKQQGARWSRGIALGLTAIAAAIPIQAMLFVRSNGTPYVPAGWASLCIVVAAALVGFDQFGGWSSGWIRYVLTSTEIGRMIDAFQADWEADRASRAGKTLTAADAPAALAKCRAFLDTVNATVQQETNVWATEFKATLKAIDDSAKLSTQFILPPAVNVNVTNGADAKDGWELTVNGSAPERCSGTTKALAGLAPGQHKFQVKGKFISGEKTIDKSAERVENIPASGSVSISLTMT